MKFKFCSLLKFAANIYGHVGQSIMKKRTLPRSPRNSTAPIKPATIKQLEDLKPVISSISTCLSQATPQSMVEFNLKTGLYGYHGPQVTPCDDRF